MTKILTMDDETYSAPAYSFTQTQGLFDIFPPVIRSVFAENCVAVAFLMAVVMNLILPKETE